MTMNPAVRPLMAAVLALSSCLAAWQVQASETYPSRVVSLLVPYPAGGLSDSIARTLNMALGRELGEQVIVENLGGSVAPWQRRECSMPPLMATSFSWARPTK